MLQINFNPFPEIETERLLLRQMKTTDAPEVFVLRSDPAILRYLGKDPMQTMEEAEEFITTRNNEIENNLCIMWVITLKENPSKVIGNISIWNLQPAHYRAELGYVLMPSYWQKGIMKEALKAVLQYGFEVMQLHSLEARLYPGNTASSSLLKSVGFVQEGFFKEDYYYNGEFGDTAVYSLITPFKK